MSFTLSLFAGAGQQFFDDNGVPLSGGKIYSYYAGTTTPLATYTTSSGTIAHTNPIILDAAGRVPAGGEIWLTTGIGYKFIVKTSTELLIVTLDNIPSSAQPPAANDADSIMYEQGYSVTAGNFVIGKTYRIVSVGTTNFTLIGATSNTPGLHFIATGVGSGTGVAELSQTVQAKLQQIVNVKDFGAVGDGVADDTAAIYAAVQNATNGLIFEGTFRLASAPPYTGAFSGAPNAYIPIISKTNFKIDASRATFIVEYDFVANNTNAGLFVIVGSENVNIDAINCYAPSNVTSRFVDGIDALLITDNGTTGSKNVYVSSIDCENVADCIRVYLSGGDAEYLANGFNSAQRSSGIYVANAKMQNGSNLSQAGYGISLQLSGDNVVVDNARFINSHRSMIAYGCQSVKANIWNTDSYAANLAFAGYGNITDFNIFLKEDGTDAVQATAANIAQLSVYDIGTTGGSSIDIQAGRTGLMKNVKVHFDVSVASRSALCYVGKEGNNVANNNILIQNVILSGFASGLSSGVRIAQAYDSPTAVWSNTTFENIVVRDMKCSASSQAVLRTGFKNALVFENYIGNSIFGSYEPSVNAYPIIYRNCTISQITEGSYKNLYAILENSHINFDNNSSLRIQPFNKQFVNSRIGTSDPINKRQHDIYSDVNSSSLSYPLSNPQATKTNLVGGAFFEGNNTDNPINLDLIAEPAATKPTSTTSRQIDHDSFVNTTDYVLINSKLFNLYVRNTAATIVAFYTGHLVLRGPAKDDFNACTIALADVSVTNIAGSSYLVGDLTVSAPDADTIRFSMSRASELMNIVLYDN
jgi:hypothetical protein